SLAILPDIRAFDRGMAAGGMRQAAQHSYRGCLAGAIWTEKTKDRSGLDLKGKIPHGMDVTETLAQMMKRDDRFIHLDLYCGDPRNLQTSDIPLLMKSSALNLPRQFPRYGCGWLVLVSLLFVGLTIARADAVSELASFSIFDKV